MDQEGVELLLSKQKDQKFGSMDRAMYQEVLRKPKKTSIEEARVEGY